QKVQTPRAGGDRAQAEAADNDRRNATAAAAAPDQAVVWSPGLNRAQWQLLECPIFEVFFGGARGGGKTDGVLGEWLSHANRYGENAIALMVRRSRTELVETIERSKQIYAPLGWK